MKKLLMETGSKAIQYLKGLDKSTDEHVYRELYSAESVNNRKFYNVGAGDFSHPCWTNVDGGSDYYRNLYKENKVGIYHDLFDHKPLAVDDGSAELIYSSHTIGHVNNEAVSHFLKDCYRMMKPGAVLRIVTPDTDLYYDAWRRNDRSFFYWISQEHYNRNFHTQCLNIPLAQASTTQLFLEEFAAAASTIALVGSDHRIDDNEFTQLFRDKNYEDALDYCTSFCTIEVQRKFPFRHMNWFNEKKLRNMLNQAGFNKVYRSGFLQSRVPVLRNAKYFDKTMMATSLFIEAEK